VPVSALAGWTATNTPRIMAARDEYDARVDSLATG
jgi:hypothetical protein